MNIDIDDCERCGAEHEALWFDYLDPLNPDGEQVYASCPTNGQLIIRPAQ